MTKVESKSRLVLLLNLHMSMGLIQLHTLYFCMFEDGGLYEWRYVYIYKKQKQTHLTDFNFKLEKDKKEKKCVCDV